MEYKPIRFLRGQHLETIIPGLLRTVDINPDKAEEIPTPDNDFLEIDWYQRSEKTLVIVSHGLEGDSTRAYMKGMAKIFTGVDISVLCWNYRGCGSKINRAPKLYHSGATDDLDVVVQYAITQGFKEIVLIGFSLGGNITLKYVGERSENISPEIKAAIAFSVPIDLAAGCRQISQPYNWMYSKRFLKKLKKKVRLKHSQYPNLVDLTGIDEIKDLKTFDDRYTATFHGFKDADDYYAQCSAIGFIPQIAVPTLIVNAKNDPFLPEECYPNKATIANDKVSFETPAHGGHVGFMEFSNKGFYWSEQRALAFVNATLSR